MFVSWSSLDNMTIKRKKTQRSRVDWLHLSMVQDCTCTKWYLTYITVVPSGHGGVRPYYSQNMWCTVVQLDRGGVTSPLRIAAFETPRCGHVRNFVASFHWIILQEHIWIRLLSFTETLLTSVKISTGNTFIAFPPSRNHGGTVDLRCWDDGDWDSNGLIEHRWEDGSHPGKMCNYKNDGLPKYSHD